MATVRRSSRRILSERTRKAPLSDLTNYGADGDSSPDLIEERSSSSIGSSFVPGEGRGRSEFVLISEEIVESGDRRKAKRKAPLAESVNFSTIIEQIIDIKHQDETTDIEPYVKTPKLNGKNKPSPKVSDDYFVLSQEFIEKQRAYFAEIDAYKLDEEIISDSDLE